MKLLRYLGSLGYGSRRALEQMLADGRITDARGRLLLPDAYFEHAALRVDGEPLDPPPGLVAMLHKPLGYTCSRRDAGHIVDELLPPRWRLRRPTVSSVGRLDRDTSGLLLLTDDGALLHRVIAPRSAVCKRYEVELAMDLRGDEGERFASGSLLLAGERRPLAPAEFRSLGPRRARLWLREGRYHQVRRMFAAVGNHVLALHRSMVGDLELGALRPGDWRLLGGEEVERIFARAPA